jgi:hypothetical protein
VAFSNPIENAFMRPPAATAAVATQDESMPPDRKMPTGTSETSWAVTARFRSDHSSAASSASGFAGAGAGGGICQYACGRPKLPSCHMTVWPGGSLRTFWTIVAGGWT